MASKGFSSSERKGILTLAVVSLLITGAGMIVGRCGHGASETSEIRKEFPAAVPTAPDTADSVRSGARIEKKSGKRVKKGKSRVAKPEEPPRSLIDEPL